MTDVLTTRDGLIGNSPRYTGYISPPYKRYLKDDAGNAINLTGLLSSAFSITFVNQSNPLLVKTGGGTFTVPPSTAAQGLVSYQYAEEDLAMPGNWYAFWTVQLSGEPSPRAFDPDFLSIVAFPGGNPIVTIQQVDLEQLGGTQISSSNPVPTSGPVTIADGANVAQGATTDSSSASTTIGLLKAIKAYLAGTLTTSGTMTETNSASILADMNSVVTATNAVSSATGTTGDAAWSGSGNGSEIAILKKLVAELAGILGVQQTDLTTTGTISAAQSGINTPVANATVVLAVGQGQSTWKAQLLAGGGGFTSGTTIVADKSPDGGTTWYSASFKVTGGTTAVSSIVGPGPLELTGNAAGVSHVRIRCSALNSTETVAVTLRGGAGISEVALLSTSGLALETGGNLASIKSDADSIKTYTSAFADTSATGTVTNDGDVVSIALPGGQATVLANILLGTLVGTLLFEASPDSGTTWVGVNGSQTATSSIATSTTSTGAWRIGVAGFTNFRIRLHPTSSGTSGTITLRVTQGVHNVAVVNASTLGQQVMANSAPVVIASDQSAIKTKSDFSEQTNLSAGALNADLVPATDVSGYKSLSLQINGNAYSGTLSFQWSNDGTNYYSLMMQRIDSNNSNGVTTTTGAAIGYCVNVFFHYFRVRMTSYTSGAAQGTLDLFTSPMTFQPGIAQQGTWTVQPGNTPNTISWVTKGATNNGAQAANSASNTVIKGSAGTLYSATVTTTGTAGLIIYDNASTNSGTILLSIPANAAVGTIYTFPGGMPAVNGITSAGVSNCPGVTFAYGPA